MKFRLLQIKRVVPLGPRMLRVTLAGEELEGFTSLAHDDHVKLFFPAPGESRPPRPEVTPEGLHFADGVEKPAARDYTPRRYDAQAGELDIDFVLHEEGVATDWARAARPGDWIGVGGPRGSQLFGAGFDWYLLAGDATALPAIARRLEELPAGAHVVAVIEVADAEDELPLASRADARVHWVHRAADELPGAALVRALGDLQLPAGKGFAWAACETETVQRLRDLLIEARGMPKDQVKVSAYWTRRGGLVEH
ncbi:siderophore-interacting protein [Pseudothauera nasutitermitis]|uniref:siderophore-interacting protein n=1 Tax=Pseudothauera nasutitermitis TaxID=2565930 RepID=UPI001B3B1E01|nr:siderophore-interacting protein [Pseudothauera nasutitermitis]